MRHSKPRLITSTLIWFLAGSSFQTNALAWNQTIQQSICLHAAKLMPANFRDILMRRREFLSRGVAGTAPLDPNRRIEMIRAKMEAIRRKLKTNVNFDDVAYEYGAIAKMVTDLNDPTTYNNDITHLRDDFQNLLYGKMSRIPVVFYGYSESLLHDKNSSAYLKASLDRSQAQIEKLVSSYLIAGRDSFIQSDDRSPGFGIAALSYSHAVSDVANVWLYIWKEANGDMSRTPFYNRSRVMSQGSTEHKP